MGFLAAVLLASSIAASAPAATAPADPHPRLTRAELMAKYRDPAGRIATIRGVEVYYKYEGHGPAILMIHGSVSTLATYDGEVAALRGRYRIIRYDIPPGGLSGPVSDQAAAEVKPADIAAGLLDKLGVKSAVVVGVSSGGTMGMFLAAARPDLVSRLILSNTPSDPVDTSHLVQPPAFVAAQAEVAKTHFQSRAFWDEYLSFFSGDPSRITPAIRERYYDFNRRVPEAHPIALVAQVANHDAAVAAMKAVKAPVLLIWGARDPLLTPPTAATLAGYLTGTRVSTVFMPDVGHYPPLEAPARFARIVEDYIEDVAPIKPQG